MHRELSVVSCGEPLRTCLVPCKGIDRRTPVDRDGHRRREGEHVDDEQAAARRLEHRRPSQPPLETDSCFRLCEPASTARARHAITASSSRLTSYRRASPRTKQPISSTMACPWPRWVSSLCPAMCGESTTLGRRRSGLSGGSGSSTNTSSAALIRRLESSLKSAASSPGRRGQRL